MKLCKACGSENKDTSKFCADCGSALTDEAPAAVDTKETAAQTVDEPVSEAPGADEPAGEGSAGTTADTAAGVGAGTAANAAAGAGAGMAAGMATGAAWGVSSAAEPVPNPVIAAIRKAATSPLFLATLCFFCVTIFLNILSPTSYDLSGIVGEYIDPRLIVGEYADPEEVFSVNIPQAILANSFNIITAVGLWLFYFDSKKQGAYPTRGLKVVKAVYIIQTVLLCVGFAAIELLLAFVVTNLRHVVDYLEELLAQSADIIGMQLFSIKDIVQEAGYSFVAALGVVFMIGLAIGFIVTLIYNLFVIATVNTVNNSIRCGAPSDKVSIFVAVFNCITASGMISLALIILASGNPIGALAKLAYGVCLVLFALCIFSYKKEMKMLQVRLQLEALKFAQQIRQV